MKMSLLTNGFNVVLDYFLIFGIGSWSGLGIVGTALGTILARLLGTVLLYRKVQQTDLAVDLKQLFRLGSPKEMVVLTLPAAAERLVMRLGQVVYFSLIVGLGTTVYASHMIAGNIESFTYMPAYGLATAAAVLIGQALGKEDILTVRRVAFLSSAYGVATMFLLGTILFFGAPSFALLFTKDLEAVRQVVTALRIDAFNQPGPCGFFDHGWRSAGLGGYQVAALLHSGRDVGAARFRRCRLRSDVRFRNCWRLAVDSD